MKGYRLWVSLALLLSAGMANATGTNINIQGRVVAKPCTVDTNTVDKEITVPSVQAHALADAATGGDWVDFELNLANCPDYLTTATVKFSGTPDADDSTTYQNIGDAQKVSLQLAASEVNYGNNSTMKVDVDKATHTAAFPLSARIYSAKGGASQGTFNSVVNVDFTYQ